MGNLGEGQCSLECQQDSECRGNEACKRLPSYQTVCMTSGSQNSGQPCTRHSECAQGLACVPIESEGYCLNASCAEGIECPINETCVLLNNVSFCVPTCASSCPQGFECIQVDQQNICYPQ